MKVAQTVNAQTPITLVALITLLFFGTSGISQEPSESNAKTSDFEQQQRVVSETIQRLGGKVQSVEKTPVDDLFLVETSTSDLIYVTGSGKHLLLGTLLELRDDATEPFNLTLERRAKSRWQLLQELQPDESINYAPADETVPANAVVYVFTDITCGYCRLLHQNIDDYNDAGIEIRYLAFPRAGVDSPSYDYLVSAWCADDPNAAMTLLKNGKQIEPKVCENPVAEQHQLGQKMRVSGTPALILADGSLVSGFRKPADLVQILEQLEN